MTGQRATHATWTAGRPVRRPLEERFWEKVERRAPDECWEWLAQITEDGYGNFWTDRHVPAHRFAYQLVVGPIPVGLTLDHLCRNRACVNPAHLEPVTQRENVLRGATLPAKNRLKTACAKGHDYTSTTTYVRPNGHRRCRICDLDRQRARARLYDAGLRASGGD